MAEDGQRRAGERHEIEIWGTFRHNGRAYEVVLRDLSTTGCRFFDRHGKLPVGLTISLRIAGIGPFEAQVKWREASYVGVQFTTQMYDPVLEHIVHLSSQPR